MQQFLIVVEIPPLPQGSVGAAVSPDWSQFSHKASTTIKTLKTATQLQPNAWLLPAEKGLPALMELSDMANLHRLSYSVVLIPDGAVTLALDVKPKP